MKHRMLWLVLVAALGGALLFACGGSDDGDNGGNDNNEPTSASTTANGDNATSDNGSTGNTDSELGDLASNLAGKQMTVSYDFSASGGGTESTGAFKLFWKSKEAYRIDITDDSDTNTSFILKDGTQYICTPDGSGSGTCIQSPVSTFPLPFLSFFTDPDSFSNLIETEANSVDFDKSSETIGGQDATCYKASGSVQGQDGSAQYCFSDDGLLLRLNGGGGTGNFNLEATSVESSVADADLDLPYDVTQIPGQ